MAAGRPLTTADHARILALRQQEVPVAEIASQLGCSRGTVYASLADARITGATVQQVRAAAASLKARGDGFVPLKRCLPVQVVVNRYLAGESIEALASSYQVSRAQLRRLLVEAGVTIRADKMRVPDGYRPWSRQECATCLRLRAEGLDHASIGLRINRSTLAVRCWLQEHDRPTQSARMVERARRRRGELLPEELPSEEVIEQLRTGWFEGRTVAAMAREFDIPSAIVSGTLKRFGVVVKPGNHINPNRIRQAAAALPPRGMPLFQPPTL